MQARFSIKRMRPRVLNGAVLALGLTAALEASNASSQDHVSSIESASNKTRQEPESQSNEWIIAKNFKQNINEVQLCGDYLKYPESGFEIFLNIRTIYLSGLLGCKEFYDTNLLKKLFRGSDAAVFSSPPVTSWTISRLGQLFQQTKLLWGLGVYIVRVDRDKNHTAIRKYKTHLTIDVGHDSRLTSQFVQALFGSSFDVTNPFEIDNPGPGVLRQPGVIPPRSSPLGNRVIIYRREDKLGIHTVAARFFGDGTVQQLTVTFEDK